MQAKNLHFNPYIYILYYLSNIHPNSLVFLEKWNILFITEVLEQPVNEIPVHNVVAIHEWRHANVDKQRKILVDVTPPRGAACVDPGIFTRGGPGQIDKKPWQLFFFFFLVLSLFYTSQMVNFKENYPFLRFQRGSNIFQGGPTFFRGGVQLLIFYRNPYNLWFSRGGLNPCPPLWIRSCAA